MQKKHLHVLLLLALLAGCGGLLRPVQNKYFVDNKAIRITLDGLGQAIVTFRAAELRIAGSEPLFSMRVRPGMEDFVDVCWRVGAGTREPKSLELRNAFRSLTAMWCESRTGQRCIALPGGRGAMLALEDRAKHPSVFSLRVPDTDSLFSLAPARVGKRVAVVRHAAGILALAASVKMDSITGLGNERYFHLAPSRRARVVLLLDTNETSARLAAERFVNFSPERVEDLALDDLRSRAAFMLHTEDQATDSAFALLASALIGATPRISVHTRGEIAVAAQMARGLFLASREQPRIVFPEAPVDEHQARENLRWGGPAFRAALDYGMARDDSLRALSLAVLTELSSLQREYVTGNADVLSDASNPDPLMRPAVAHVQLADLMTLGERICMARNEHQGQNGFRIEAIRARRAAQRFFTESAQRYRGQPADKRKKLVEALDSTAADTSEPQLTSQTRTFPDTTLFLLAGARHGFNWLDDRPELFWNPRLGVGTFTWQRWVAYRLRWNVTLKETADYDSLLSYLLDGSLPGMLTMRPRVPGEPSWTAMAAALENLAEVYLGVRPDALRNRVEIEPRPPARWGRTIARVPYRTGFILIEYDFAHERAVVGMSGIEQPQEVFFGWPLREAGFLRTQFVLDPGQHPMRIDLERFGDNRLKLKVSEVP